MTLVAIAACCASLASQPPPAAARADSSVAAPNDPLFRFQWNLHAIGIPQAWAVSRGAGATVAVLDTGVAYRTRGPYRQAPDFARTRFVAGYDFVDDDPYPDDVAPPGGRRSHGTLMAGIIAQNAGNGIGAAGVAPEATIMPVRILEPDLVGTASRFARGVRFAADHGADVINLSISGPTDTRVVARAIGYAARKGAIIVAAAGNDGLPTVGWPAADRRVIAVGATARDASLAAYSNHGERLDIVAPAGAGEVGDSGRGPADGVLAQTLERPGRFCFCFSASTSAAAAHVSGVAALLVASGRATTRGDVRRALLAGARDLGDPGRDDRFGSGLVQAARSLQAAAPGSPDPAALGGEQRRAGDGGTSWWLVSVSAIAVLLIAAALWLWKRRRGLARAHPDP